MADSDVNWAELLAEVINTAGVTPEALDKIMAAVERARIGDQLKQHLGELRLASLGRHHPPPAPAPRPDATPPAPVTSTKVAQVETTAPPPVAKKGTHGGTRPGCNGWLGRATCKLCGRDDIAYRIIDGQELLRGHNKSKGGDRCDGLYPKAGTCLPYEQERI